MLFEEILPLLRSGFIGIVNDESLPEVFQGSFWRIVRTELPDNTFSLNLMCMSSEGKVVCHSNLWGIPNALIFSDGWEVKK